MLESESFDHSDYSNPDHLNEKGLNKLSRILFSQILNEWLFCTIINGARIADLLGENLLKV